MASWNADRRQDIEKVLSETDDEPTQIDRIAEIRSWFRPTSKNLFYPTVQAYINDSADLQATVAKLTQPIDEALTASKIDKINLMDLWYSIFHSAKRISYRDADQHTKLIDLLKAIREHPEPASTYEYPTYSTLSDLDMAGREVSNDGPRFDLGVFLAEIHAWANFNYFMARVTDSGISEHYLHAIWAMREALEKTPEPLRGWYDANVPAAAVWIFGLGKKLYEREEDLTPKSKNLGNPAKGGDLWTGGPVFSKERWAFWKSRFGAVAESEGVSEETKNIAKEAVEAMERVEGA